MNPPVEIDPAREPMLPRTVRVREYQQETHDTFTLTIDAPREGYSYNAGQFNMLYVFGVGEVPISMSGNARDSRMLMHTIRGVGAVTNALADLRPGDMVGARGPFGQGWPVEDAKGCDLVIVSGGIGLAPLRPLICHVLHNRQDFGRLVLLHGIRTPQDLFYADELKAWAQQDDCQVLVIVGQADQSWNGPIGVVTALFPMADFNPSRTIGFMCGPEVMMRFTLREFEKRGVAHDHVYLSLERNMQCALGFCGHCQFGPSFVCMDGPVFRYDRIKNFFDVREI